MIKPVYRFEKEVENFPLHFLGGKPIVLCIYVIRSNPYSSWGQNVSTHTGRQWLSPIHSPPHAATLKSQWEEQSWCCSTLCPSRPFTQAFFLFWAPCTFQAEPSSPQGVLHIGILQFQFVSSLSFFICNCWRPAFQRHSPASPAHHWCERGASHLSALHTYKLDVTICCVNFSSYMKCSLLTSARTEDRPMQLFQLDETMKWLGLLREHRSTPNSQNTRKPHPRMNNDFLRDARTTFNILQHRLLRPNDYIQLGQVYTERGEICKK